MKYTDEKNTLILISLLKKNNISRIVASPGTTNISFVASVQQDPYFKVYSAPDERSAAYIACGMSVENNEPVVLSCTGATASRNYMPGLTEAYYRNIPILAVTSTQHLGRICQNVPQVIDRTNVPNDVCRLSVQCQSIFSDQDEWDITLKINRALLELKRDRGGPVHINLATTYSTNFNITDLPDVQYIQRHDYNSTLPEIDANKVAILVGSHRVWDEDLTNEVEKFCLLYDAVVLVDHTSNYKGNYKVLANLVTSQEQFFASCRNIDLMICIGDVSGAYIGVSGKSVWRVNPDGEIRDTYKNLHHVFQMDELTFFKRMNSKMDNKGVCRYYNEWIKIDNELRDSIPELPFSNVWVAQKLAPLIPNGSVLHLGILNTLRSWNFFHVDDSINCYSNTGGFGIDGIVSTLIGASLIDTNRLYFGILGDLAFFYDMNSLGNRHVGSNIRILVINNGTGTEFRNYMHPGSKFGDQANDYIAAGGHYGNKSLDLLRHYSQDLGFQYIKAENKDEFMENIQLFVSESNSSSIIFEVFTTSDSESSAQYVINNLKKNSEGQAKRIAKTLLGENGYKSLKKALGK